MYTKYLDLIQQKDSLVVQIIIRHKSFQIVCNNYYYLKDEMKEYGCVGSGTQYILSIIAH